MTTDQKNVMLIPYDPAHMDLFVQTDEDIERYGKITSDMANPMAEHGVCFSAIKDGRVLVVGGVLQTTANTGHCWTMVSQYASGHGLSVLKTVKGQLESMMESMNIHRVETANLVKAKEHHRWCKLLGFHEEGVMRYYDDKKRDYIRFAKYRED